MMRIWGVRRRALGAGRKAFSLRPTLYAILITVALSALCAVPAHAAGGSGYDVVPACLAPSQGQPASISALFAGCAAMRSSSAASSTSPRTFAAAWRAIEADAACPLVATLPAWMVASQLAAVGSPLDTRALPLLPLTCASTHGAHALLGALYAQPVRVATRSASTARSGRGRHGGTSRRAGSRPISAGLPLQAPLADPVSTSDYILLGAKVALVLVLLLVCLRVLRAILPRLSGHGAQAPRALILHAESLGGKEKVQFLDLGCRIAVIGVSPSGVSPLFTVDDPDEIEELRLRFGRGNRRQASAVRAVEPAGAESAKPSFAGLLAAAGAGLETESKASTAVALVPAPGPAATTTTRRSRKARRRKKAATRAETPLVHALEALRALRSRVERI